MNVAFRTVPPTVEEFLAWERELRYEFDGREAIPMGSRTLRRGRIGLKLAEALGALLGGGLG